MSTSSSSGPFSADSVADLRKSRIVQLEGGQRRADADNCRTGIIIPGGFAVDRTLRDLFIAHYAHIRKVVTRFAKPGVAIVAIDEHRNQVAGSACVAAKVGSINSAIIGRHSCADLYLNHDASMSLRHLALVIDPLRSCSASSDLRYRIVDLRSGTAFEDERGSSVEAVTAEGPVFIRCGSYALFCVTTDDGVSWPDDAEDGWECIPERIYLQKRAAEPDRWQRDRPAIMHEHTGEVEAVRSSSKPSAVDRITLVGTSPGPMAATSALLADGEETLGRIRIWTRQRTENLLVGATALDRGILLGRYDRCESNARSVLRRDSISRVHMLLLRVHGKVYIIDTASSNGTWFEVDAGADADDSWRRVRVMPLVDGLTFCLGNERTLVRWIPA